MAAERVPGDLGRKLREARERQGVSLREIADRTKIAVSVLEALERNDISRLPGGIFGRAFVRSFATEIGLDPEATIQEFIVQFPQDSVTVGHPRSLQIVDHEALESNRRMASTVLGLVAVAVPIAAGVVYLSMAGRGTEPADARPAPTVAARSAAGEPAVTPARSQRAVTDTATPTAPVAGKAGDDRVTVALTVTRSSWVSAIVDGEKQVERRLQSGEQRTLQVRRELVLTVGDAGGVEIVVNGTAARPLGKDGEVVTKRLTRDNLTEFLPPR
jgi:cytoskeleton protein RodZ